MQTLRQLVAGTDFSREADNALALALELAASSGAQVTLVHVCELDGDGGDDDQRLAQCGEALARLVATHRQAGAAVSGVLRCGRPWEKLDNVAAEVGARLIVVGRRGTGRARNGQLGSVAEHLVRCASRPVLTVACPFDHEHE
jgi:nucleotide-binding universal stress UspA family protein